jgi:hypothetical protein
MSNTALRNLTLASAKHLLTQGHISEAKHKTIVKKAKKAPQAVMAGPPMADEASFGSLNPMGAGAGHYMGSMPEET